MQKQISLRRTISPVFGLYFTALLLAFPFVVTATFQEKSLTPLQSTIRQQQQRFSSGDDEERRDAIMQLGLLHQTDASRAALPGLNDASIAVRIAAINSILSLPSSESAAALVPLLMDKNAFVRQETAYALGQTGSRSAVAPLIELLSREKEAGTRGAAVVSLGRLRDEAAVVPLVQILGSTGKRREQNVLVLRAAARSLGEIGSRASVTALIAVLENEKYDSDVRREAAEALGKIGDPSATHALRSALAAGDPYLSLAAERSLKLLSAKN